MRKRVWEIFYTKAFLRSKIIISCTSLLICLSHNLHIFNICPYTKRNLSNTLTRQYSGYNMIHLERSSNLGESREQPCFFLSFQAWMIVLFAGTLFAWFSFTLRTMRSRRSTTRVNDTCLLPLTRAPQRSGSGTSPTLEKVSRARREPWPGSERLELALL